MVETIDERSLSKLAEVKVPGGKIPDGFNYSGAGIL